ncbi:hypothetical protein [Burkholderia ubonensis]|uniref:hypothetical protein n=1 Tax=Burkholderia ubonensis TaxID=101571 RepID=UPI000A7B9F76|nr:hypothetical protein [Burkholderia ubonensis]
MSPAKRAAEIGDIGKAEPVRDWEIGSCFLPASTLREAVAQELDEAFHAGRRPTGAGADDGTAGLKRR